MLSAFVLQCNNVAACGVFSTIAHLYVLFVSQQTAVFLPFSICGEGLG